MQSARWNRLRLESVYIFLFGENNRAQIGGVQHVQMPYNVLRGYALDPDDRTLFSGQGQHCPDGRHYNVVSEGQRLFYSHSARQWPKSIKVGATRDGTLLRLFKEGLWFWKAVPSLSILKRVTRPTKAVYPRKNERFLLLREG